MSENELLILGLRRRVEDLTAENLALRSFLLALTLRLAQARAFDLDGLLADLDGHAERLQVASGSCPLDEEGQVEGLGPDPRNSVEALMDLIAELHGLAVINRVPRH